MRNFTPGDASTKLLYAGEMYDSTAAQYYLRARWYSPVTGRFNRMDPFAGSNRDPQSLHKYLYAHCNPINGMDPGGLFFGGGFSGIAISMGIGAVVFGIIGGVAGNALGIGGARGVFLGAIFGAALGAGAATGTFLSVLFSGVLDGLANLAVEFFMQGYVEQILSSNGSDYSNIDTSRLVDAFFTGLAYGAAAAAVSVGVSSLKLNKYWAVLASGGAAAFISIVKDYMDSYIDGQKPNVGEMLLNAVVAFVVAVATQPEILFKMGFAKDIPRDALWASTQRFVSNAEKCKYALAKIFEAIVGGSLSFGIQSITKSGAADLSDIY